MELKLSADKKGKPVAIVILEDESYHIPLKHSAVIHVFNQILKTLDTGIEIKFESYAQYTQLLKDVSEAIQKKKATA